MKVKCKDTKNIANLKELFNGYLYYLKIYSPYVNIDNLIKLRSEQQEAQNKNKTNTDKKVVEHVPINNINNNQNNINNDSIYEEFSMFKDNNDFLSFNLNLEKIIHLNHLLKIVLYFIKYKKEFINSEILLIHNELNYYLLKLISIKNN